MPTVIFLCGLAASGKTTFAKRLAAETGAVRFSLDERMIAQTDLTIFDEEYGRLVQQEKALIWQEALVLLHNGQDVILDWSLWSRAARREWTQRAIDAGFAYELVYLKRPLALLQERLAQRNQHPSNSTHVIPLEALERFSHIFEPPTAEERLNLRVVGE